MATTGRVFVRRLLWGLFGLLMLALLLDYLTHQGGHLARGAFFGLSLGFFVQLIFYWLSHRHGKLAHGTQMFLDMAIGLVVKWLLALAGFALIFRFGDTHTPAVLIGVFLMCPVATFAYARAKR